MAQMMLKTVTVCLLLALAAAQGNSTNGTNSSSTIQFAPPPPINTSIVLVMNNSQIGGRFIGSGRLESLQLAPLPNDTNGLPQTNFILTTFDRNSPRNARVFMFNQSGNWSYVGGTRNTLSCSLVHEAGRDLYGAVQFSPENGTFRLIYQNLLSNFTNTTLAPQEVARKVILKQNCDALYIENILYKIRPNNTLLQLATPTSWNVTSTPESIMFGVAANILYRFDPMNGTFTNIYTFPQNQAYGIRSFQGRLLVVSANSTLLNNNMTQINQRFSVFNIAANNTLRTVGNFAVTGVTPDNLPILPYLASPQLSKIGIIFNPPNATNATNATNTTNVSIWMKSVDYTANAINNLPFQQLNRFLATIQGLLPGNKDFYFGDNYYILRNSSAFNGSNIPVEEAYQFIGNQIIFLRNRILNTSDITDFQMLYADTFYNNQLVILNTFNKTGAVEVDEFVFGSLAAINRVVPQATPPFISFTLPPFTNQFLPGQSLSWAFLNAGNVTGNNTNITILSANASAPNNIQSVNSTLPGNQKILVMNQNCFLLFDIISGNYTVATNAPPSNNSLGPYQLEDITPLVANMSVGNTTQWGLSGTCDRFSADTNIFFRTPNQTHFRPILNNSVLLNASAINGNLDTAIVGNSVWFYNPQTNNFANVFTNPQPFLPNINVQRQNNSIIIAGVNGTSAQVLAFFIESTGNFTNCLNFFFPFYQNAPKIQVSSRLSKVLIMGPFIPPNRTQIQPKFDAFFINYANRTAQNISFPLDRVPNPVDTFILLDEQYLYIRSLHAPNATNGTNSTASPQENIFFIDQDVTPKLASSTNLTQVQLDTWKRVIFAPPTGDGNMNIYIETLGGNSSNQVVVTKLQVSKQQANLNSNSNQGITGILVNGKIKLCSVGCSACSSGTCTGCLSGYAYDSSAYLCYRCGQNCLTCSSSNYQLCYLCIPGSYLSNSTCLPCDRSCTSCNGTATSCISCLPSQTYVNGRCTSCPNNCIACLNATVCITCTKGFVNANGTCRGCSMSCSNCSTTNITQCTSCAPGLNLVNSACISCPDKCQSCNNGICTTCIPGFSPNAAGTCVLNCQVTCATCVDNQPATCLSCYSGASLSNGTCVFNISCNSDSSCTDCGQGLGYALVGSLCVACDSISNCIQCSSPNTNECARCLNGYYIDSTYLCASCNSNCTNCMSADVCTGCAIGFTLPENQTQGQCLKCSSPCATCLGVTDYCLSCVDGYTKKGWKCQNNKYVGFVFTLSDTPENILNNVDYIVVLLLSITRQNSTNVQAITFDYIRSGSTVVSGAVTSQDPSTTGSALASSLSSGSFGSYVVTSTSITTYGVDSTSEEKSKTGLIVGLAVGLSVLVIAVVVIGYVIYQKKKASQILANGEFIAEMHSLPVDQRVSSNIQSENYPIQIVPQPVPQYVPNENSAHQTWEKEVF